ncbi:MAG TPA: ParB/RepB/Spo0J family partition protein [Gammaproteobacteria bacterium]|nr:ParB/RepB/Spo0J family partition protein [Gammaproteobacteria bacterium]
MSTQNSLAAIEALLEAKRGGEPSSTAPRETAVVVEADVEALRPGRYQPRQQLSEEALAELADSIREQGVLQPLVVRPVEPSAEPTAEPSYEIVAGERRWRAAMLAGLQTVPVIVRGLSDQSALAVALIENLQREDLNPIDQARSLSRLAGEFELTHEQVAKAVGRSRASVSNLLRLLDLQEEVKELLVHGRIDMGHARALLPLDAERQVAMARRTQSRGLSVRQVEKAVRVLLTVPPESGAERPVIDMQTRWLQHQIAQELGQTLTIQPGRNGRYTLQIGFEDLGQLQAALERIQELVAQIRSTAGPRVRDAKK